MGWTIVKILKQPEMKSGAVEGPAVGDHIWWKNKHASWNTTEDGEHRVKDGQAYKVLSVNRALELKLRVVDLDGTVRRSATLILAAPDMEIAILTASAVAAFNNWVREEKCAPTPV